VFESPTDFNAQLTDWLVRANSRTVRAIAARPVDLIDTDRAAMHPLPTVAPAAGFSAHVRLPRDYYLRVLGNDYSVDPRVIGRMVDIHADLDAVTARCDGTVVATHARVWAHHQTVTDPAHVQIAAGLREALHTNICQPTGDELVRDLADYDIRFGVDFSTDDTEGVA
jgi:hypothetical protein